ncbi:MAG: hypothetical protein KGI14_09505, partial [Acidobacteriota bacterium]|nr:hypothetical protein [Acidobacteriota bacterium]
MTITAVGSLVKQAGGVATTLAVSPTATGDVLVLALATAGPNSSLTPTGGGVSVWKKALEVANSTNDYCAIWYGEITATGAQTISFGSYVASACQQFHSTNAGTWTLDGAGSTITSLATTSTVVIGAPTASQPEVVAFGVASFALNGGATGVSASNAAYATDLSLIQQIFEYDVAYTNSTGTNDITISGQTTSNASSLVALLYMGPYAVAGNVSATAGASGGPLGMIAYGAGNVAATFDSMITTNAGFSDPAVVPWMLPVSINDHPYMMDFLKSRITTMQIRRQASDESVEPGEQCVDEATEILTRRGWILHDDLRVGDVALTLNMASGLSEWNVVEDV